VTLNLRGGIDWLVSIEYCSSTVIYTLSLQTLLNNNYNVLVWCIHVCST